MDTLYLNNIRPKHYKKSDRLFYDRFRYCVKTNIKSVTALRKLPTDSLASCFSTVEHNFSVQIRYVNYGGNWSNKYSDETTNQTTLRNLLDFVELLYPHLTDIHIILYPNWVYVYTNNLELCKLIHHKPYALHTSLIEVEVDRPRGTLRVPNSSYKERSYFRERWIPNEKMNSLKLFLQAQQDIRLCSSLSKALEEFPSSKRKNFWLQRHYHFDHNDSKIGFMIEMIMPGVIRQTVTIIDK